MKDRFHCVLRSACAYILAGALVACAPQTSGTYRDPSAPFGATTRFDPVSFAGEWELVASFDPAVRGRVSFTHDPSTQTVTLTSDVIPAQVGVYAIDAPGVLVKSAPPEETLVVMWVDEGFRTAVIGTVSGDFGAVINRGTEIPRDRDTAAREILAFYGWDVSQLKRIIP